MGKLEETQEAYYGPEEKVIVEKDRMGLVQALGILHSLRDGLSSCGEIQEAFQVVFEWIDNMVILLHELGGNHESKGNKTE